MTLALRFAPQAWEDYVYWQATDKALLRRINELVRAIQREPFAGIGKPEALKHQLAGWRSRRINDEHRIVYRVKDDALEIAQLRYHYGV